MQNETKTITQYQIGKMIREAREAKGWTIYSVAAESGIHEAAIWRIERGVNSIRVDTLQKLCTALDLEVTFPLKF